MARKKRLVAPPVWLAPALCGLLVLCVLIAGLFPAVPISIAEAAQWQRALGGPFLPLDAPPLGSWLVRIALFVGGDVMASLRLSALAMLAVLVGCLSVQGRMAILAALSAPLVWWLILSGLSASVLLAAAAPFAVMLERATALRPKKEKHAPLQPWLILGAAAALMLHAQPALIAPVVATLALLLWRGLAWRGPVLALGAIAVLMLPYMIWCAATQGAALEGMILPRGSVAWWELTLAALALGPFLLIGLRGATDAVALWIWSLAGFAVLLALLERGDPMLMAALVTPLALRQAQAVQRGAVLILLSLPGLVTGVVTLGLTLLYAQFATGLPAAADPFANRRGDAAFCQDVLLMVEEEGANALLGAQREPLLPCAWQGGLIDMLVIALDAGGPLPLRQMQGPLALDGTGLLVAFWPDDGTGLAAQFAWSQPLGEGATPDHTGTERRFSLWLVEDWTGR